jgi:hypothetical protein
MCGGCIRVGCLTRGCGRDGQGEKAALGSMSHHCMNECIHGGTSGQERHEMAVHQAGGEEMLTSYALHEAGLQLQAMAHGDTATRWSNVPKV